MQLVQCSGEFNCLLIFLGRKRITSFIARLNLRLIVVVRLCLCEDGREYSKTQEGEHEKTTHNCGIRTRSVVTARTVGLISNSGLDDVLNQTWEGNGARRSDAAR